MFCTLAEGVGIQDRPGVLSCSWSASLIVLLVYMFQLPAHCLADSRGTNCYNQSKHPAGSGSITIYLLAAETAGQLNTTTAWPDMRGHFTSITNSLSPTGSPIISYNSKPAEFTDLNPHQPPTVALDLWNTKYLLVIGYQNQELATISKHLHPVDRNIKPQLGWDSL